MEKIGTVFVDAGIVSVGDPCYVLGDEASSRVTDWHEFCDKMFNDTNYDKGYATPLGKGTLIVVDSGYGDGEYPVYIERDPGTNRVAKLIVEFIPEEDEADDDPCDYWGHDEDQYDEDENYQYYRCMTCGAEWEESK